MSEYLSKSAILEADDAQYLDVSIPEWGGRVRLRAPSAAALDRFEMQQAQLRKLGHGGNNLRARFAILVCVDEKGEPLFTANDEQKLSHRNAVPLSRIWVAGNKWLGLDDDSVETEAKNSQPTTDEGSSLG